MLQGGEVLCGNIAIAIIATNLDFMVVGMFCSQDVPEFVMYYARISLQYTYISMDIFYDIVILVSGEIYLIIHQPELCNNIGPGSKDKMMNSNSPCRIILT